MASDSAVETVSLPLTLDDAKISSLPSSAFYIPNFLSEAEEAIILDKVCERVASAPKPRWQQLTHRRLQTWPSDLVNDALLAAPLPAWLEEPVISRLLSLPLSSHQPSSIFSNSPHGRPNHVLINEYPPGVGIMPHKDGAAYHPVVCTVSLGSSLCLNLYRRKDDGALDPIPAWRILQEPRSLLITTDALYTDFLHGIEDVAEDVDLGPETVANWDLLRSSEAFAAGRNARGLRTSLTYRDVLKVPKLGKTLGLLFSKK